MADIKSVNPQLSQRMAIQGNLDNADSIEALLARSNSFNQGEANRLTEAAMPGYANLSKKFLGQADSLISDPYGVPKDVSDNLTRIAGERGLSTGVRGEAGDFSLLRDFGINSLQAGGQRISQAQSILQTIGGLAPRVNPMSPLSFYVTPGQQMNAEASNNAIQGGAAQAKLNADAAASNANSSMWGGIVANAGGIAAGTLATRNAGAGGGSGSDAGFIGATSNRAYSIDPPKPVEHLDETWRF